MYLYMCLYFVELAKMRHLARAQDGDTDAIYILGDDLDVRILL